MEQIKITDIRLKNLHVTTNLQERVNSIDRIQANMKVQYDFKAPTKYVDYDICVQNGKDHWLYKVKLEYQFCINDSNFLEKDILDELFDLIEPRLEDILMLMATEGKFVKKL